MSDDASASEGHQAKPPIRKATCSECGGERNCDIKGSHTVRYEDSANPFWGETTWYILQCRGCDHVFAQKSSVNSEDVDQGYDHHGEEWTEYNETVDYWPALSKRKKPDWLGEYAVEGIDGDLLTDALRELYTALDNDLLILATIGVRTCFDLASELLGVDPALTFAEKLDALVEANHIRQLDRERLAAAVEAGNASAHRGWKPTPADLDTMATVLEDFLHETFVRPHRRQKLDEAAAKVRGVVPPRLPRKKKQQPSVPPASAP